METLALGQNETVTVFLPSEKLLSQWPEYPQFVFVFVFSSFYSTDFFFFKCFTPAAASQSEEDDACFSTELCYTCHSFISYLLEKEMATHSSILA